MVFNYEYNREIKRLTNAIMDEINMSGIHIEIIEKIIGEIHSNIINQIDRECRRVEEERRQKALEEARKEEEKRAAAADPEEAAPAAGPEGHPAAQTGSDKAGRKENKA